MSLFRGIEKLIKFLIGLLICTGFFAFIGFIVICLVYPIAYYDDIKEFSKKYDLDVAFVCAVIHTESGFDKSAQSHKGARGLMQIMPDTAKWAVEQMGLEDFDYTQIDKPSVNIEIGCWLLSYLSKQLNNDDMLVAAAYNAGIGNVNKWLNDEEYSDEGGRLHTIPFGETSRYVKKVSNSEKIYKIILRTGLYEIKIN